MIALHTYRDDFENILNWLLLVSTYDFHVEY